jgi:hypothetical protein
MSGIGFNNYNTRCAVIPGSTCTAPQHCSWTARQVHDAPQKHLAAAKQPARLPHSQQLVRRTLAPPAAPRAWMYLAPATAIAAAPAAWPPAALTRINSNLVLLPLLPVPARPAQGLLPKQLLQGAPKAVLPADGHAPQLSGAQGQGAPGSRHHHTAEAQLGQLQQAQLQGECKKRRMRPQNSSISSSSSSAQRSVSASRTNRSGHVHSAVIILKTLQCVLCTMVALDATLCLCTSTSCTELQPSRPLNTTP